ncbi:tetratricopeptide repeat protein [Candidatus Gottesmanbacteria bacterium]|nr:tetratricopeptide repeat protein [Candidatus Gottesmanbacteria bacterium]
MTDPSPSAQEAIAKALIQDWPEAIRINTAIIEEDKNNIDALNRLAFAYFQTGDTARAKRFYQKVLLLDGYNQIATKNIKKLSSVKRKTAAVSSKNHVSPLMFLEEPGKTKIVLLVNLAPERTLAALHAGQEVFFKAKRHDVEIRTSDGVYLGALPDDLSFKLIKFLAGGNQYYAVIKSIGKNQLVVFIREVSRGKRFANQPSFVNTASFLPFTRTESSEGPDMNPTGEGNDEEELKEEGVSR